MFGGSNHSHQIGDSRFDANVYSFDNTEKGTIMTDTVTPIKKAKQRAAEASQNSHNGISTDQEQAIRQLANDLHRLNHSVMKAVDAGVSVELVRSARHHGEGSHWGDLMIPIIVKG